MAIRIANLAERALRSRTLMRTPIWVYRARLGFVFGSRLLMLEHIGRRTGTKRYVVLEVMGHPNPDTYLVASGFGTWAQWFRNVAAEPRVHISTGTHRSLPTTARQLSTAEADAALQAYIAERPRAWETLKPALEKTLGSPISDHDTKLPLVEFRLVGTP